jgi:DNA-binding transcriptional LysR family regulator
MSAPNTTSPDTSSRIELRHLRYFLAVFEELHFGRAAQTLHMAQPPLSQAIRRLEEYLGVPLFERTSRSVSPTEAGRVFADEARRLLGDLDLAVAATRRNGALATELRIGCVHDLPLERLLRFIAALKQHDPTVEPRVTHLPAVEQLRRLRRGELDLGVFHDAREQADIETEPLFAGSPMVALLPSGHPLAAQQVLGQRELRDEVLVSFSRLANPPLHDRMLAEIERAGYRFRHVHEVAGAETRDLLAAVAQNIGVAFAPSTITELSEGSVGVARRLDPAPAMPSTVVAWYRSARGWPASVLDTVRVVARQLATAEGIDPTQMDIGQPAG